MNRCLYTDDVVRHQLAHGVVRVHVTYLSVPLGSRVGYSLSPDPMVRFISWCTGRCVISSITKSEIFVNKIQASAGLACIGVEDDS
jgi:hypothetical protein